MRVGRTTARPGMTGPTCCTGGKNHLPRCPTHRYQCKWQRSKQKGTFFLVRALRVRLRVQLQQVMPAAPPGAGDRSRLSEKCIVLPCCCILLLYIAGELRAQVFEFICLTWVELRGFEPLTSCMPSAGSTSTAVRLCRSPSQEVRARPVKSAPVAVLSCCTGQPARPGSQGAPDQPEPPRTLPRCSPRRPASDRARSVPQSTGGSPPLRPPPLPLPTAASPRSELPATAESFGRQSPAGHG